MAKRKMRFSAVCLASVLAIACFLNPNPAGAWVNSCKTCGTDAYDQNVCLEFAQIGPEGFVYCYAYSWGCVLSQPCSWV